MVSIVLPIFNAEAHIGAQLAALAMQTYAEPWELVAVDNGCTDSSISIVESWRHRFPQLVIVEACLRRGANHARNVGAAAAQ